MSSVLSGTLAKSIGKAKVNELASSCQLKVYIRVRVKRYMARIPAQRSSLTKKGKILSLSFSPSLHSGTNTLFQKNGKEQIADLLLIIFYQAIMSRSCDDHDCQIM